jgi:hypothetical protein
MPRTGKRNCRAVPKGLLPLKDAVRKPPGLASDDSVTVELLLLLEP